MHVYREAYIHICAYIYTWIYTCIMQSPVNTHALMCAHTSVFVYMYIDLLRAAGRLMWNAMDKELDTACHLAPLSTCSLSLTRTRRRGFFYLLKHAVRSVWS